MGIFKLIEASWSYVRFYYKKLVLKDKIWIKRIYDFRMSLPFNDPGISRYLSIFGEREKDHKFMIESVLKKRITVLDVGANIGYYVLIESKMIGPAGKIYALEPSPFNYQQLICNIKLNNIGNIVEPFQIALSNKRTREYFYISPLSNLNTFHPVEKTKSLMKKVIVDTVDVVAFLKDKKLPDLIRMDVEGHEVEIFESLIEAIKLYHFYPAIIFEPHFPRYNEKHNIRRQLVNLFSLGYKPTLISSTDEKKAKFKEQGYHPFKIIKSDFMSRGIYNGISKEDAIKFICDIGFVRTVLLEWKD